MRYGRIGEHFILYEFVGFFGVKVVSNYDTLTRFLHNWLSVFDDLAERRYMIKIGKRMLFRLEIVLVEVFLY